MASFFHRLHRLARADAHGILDSLEDRALLLKQHLREAELELQHKRARVAALADEEHRLAEDAERLTVAVRSLDEDTRLALAEGREDLARFAIRRLLPRRSEVDALGARATEIAEERRRLAETLAQQESDFEELRARVRAHIAEERSGAAATGDPELVVPDEDVEMELLRRLRTAEGGAS
jgi:phage shock protein A